MIDVLGFHDDRDLHTELAALRRDLEATAARCTIAGFSSPEQSWNTWGRLDSLRHQIRVLTREAAMEDQRLHRLAQAVQIVGDVDLGFIAYVAFGPQALPVEPLYEVRLIDPNGYTVPGTIRTNLPAARLEDARQALMTVDGPAYARRFGYQWRGYSVQTTAF
ncbi:hypothetical protein [Streptomyces sp. NPDC005548]|uniref:hypothetical protein n=1 Tax=Streptomyces sp. NPDC005548 TaxID=3364724 RepID=UPI0036A022B8